MPDTCPARQRELIAVKAEVLHRVLVDVGQRHEILEERVPANRIAQADVGLGGEAGVSTP
jgi:hypothetical protein